VPQCGSALPELWQCLSTAVTRLSAAMPHLPGSTKDRIAKLAVLAKALRVFGG